MANQKKPTVIREHERSAVTPGFGRSYYYITCPFCDYETRAFVWSIAGKGKKCDGCGAMHYSNGMTEGTSRTR